MSRHNPPASRSATRRLRLDLSREEALTLGFVLALLLNALTDAPRPFLDPDEECECCVRRGEERLAAALDQQERDEDDEVFFSRHIPF